MAPIKVLIVDDSVDLVAAFSLLIRRESDLQVVGALHSADDVLPVVAQLCPDVVVMDLTMPGKDPLEAIRELSRAAPDCVVLACSGYDDPDTVSAALKAGARRCVSKHDDVDRLIGAIRGVVRRG